MRVPYYFGHLKRDPNLEKHPYVGTEMFRTVVNLGSHSWQYAGTQYFLNDQGT